MAAPDSEISKLFRKSFYYIDLPDRGRVPLFNVLGFNFAKYPAVPVVYCEDSIDEIPSWYILATHWKIDAIPSAHVEPLTYEIGSVQFRESHSDSIELLAKYESVRIMECMESDRYELSHYSTEVVLEFLRGKAILCSAEVASVLGRPEYGIFCLIPSSDEQMCVRDAQKRKLGYRALFNATQ